MPCGVRCSNCYLHNIYIISTQYLHYIYLQVISEAEGVAITAVYLRLCAHANALEYFARGRQKLMFG